MFKTKIKYTDFNGTEREEDFYFNFTKAEVLELELGTAGGLAESIERLIAAQDMPEIIRIFKKLVLDAYGEKSADGKRFIKNEEIREAFSQTEAYSELFMKLATNADEAAKFVKAIIPADIDKKVADHPALKD